MILAAGKGVRMRSPVAKVLHPLGGRPMVRLLLDGLARFSDMRAVCVVGHDREAVKAALPPGVATVVQWPPRGTGDAVRVARSKFSSADVLVVMPGDAPLVTPETLRKVLDHHRREKALATVLTAVPDDPADYGRVVQYADGSVRRIVEAVDADPETLQIRRINTGIYAFDPKALLSVIGQLRTSNKKGEFYLTDTIELLSQRGRVAALNVENAEEAAGINDQADLSRMEGVLQKRLRRKLLENGVQMPHPQSVYLEPEVRVSGGARLLPGTHLCGRTVVASGAVIGPDAFVVDSKIGVGVKIWYSVVEHSVVCDNATVGPFAHLRPKTRIEKNARVGNFVEIKSSRLGRGARALHLAYLGDAQVGEDANIGAGTITCNFDGYKKHPTIVASGAFIGSNTSLVAPVSVGAGAFVGAGSVITKNVPAGSLALTRAPQVVRSGWAKRRRALMTTKTKRPRRPAGER